MEVLKETAAHLSNYEVLEILKGLKSNKTQKSRNQLATITYQTTALEIQLIVEDGEDRLSEEEVESLLQVITEHFGEEVREEDEDV
ncbi:DNA-directed RNA polymerase III subunit RPC9 isoform X2 [Venturia canescens]|uniref:DNA-directed RNA polymerase III subunit RPC9 isoform X2 n=1 Tax=Venturia canescens TaxID=32260 RepID=UPI001C9D4BDD|nr:DNA-directed RNA polymerase III subunit RPC9 isoform X2 [Venturia canescens]